MSIIARTLIVLASLTMAEAAAAQVAEPDGTLGPAGACPQPLDGGIAQLVAVETAVEAAQAEGVRQVKASPVARNATALRFFHELGFDTLGRVDLLLDLERPKGYWRERERLAEREFRA